MTYLYLLTGFVLLIKGADLLVDGAASIARKMNVSNLVIGLTVVAFGTSSPELFVNVASSIKGSSALAVGNVIGSNISNILLVLGVCALIYPLNLKAETVKKEIPFCLLSALIFGFLANYSFTGSDHLVEINRMEGLLLLLLGVGFIVYSFRVARVSGFPVSVPVKEDPYAKSVLFFVLGAAGLSFGAKMIVSSAIKIAFKFGISESFMGLTVIAIGTSLPELAASVAAVRRKNVDMAIGNILGSNILNVFLIIGLSAIIRPLEYNIADNVSMLVMIAASLMFFIAMFTGKKYILEKWEGSIFLVSYFFFLMFLIFNMRG